MAETERPLKIQKRVCEDRLSSLPDDLLIHILLRVPTKDAVGTTFLSKRWRYVWTMLPTLTYKRIKNSSNLQSKSVWWFLDETMRFHKAPLLKRLQIKLGKRCPDVVKWVSKVLDRSVSCLYFKLLWKSEPTRMPNSLYTSKTLLILILSDKIIVDVPCPVSLPSLTELNLLYVVYKDEDSHVRLLSGCPVLKDLMVFRCHDVDDNVKKFSVKVPSLLSLIYSMRANFQEGEDDDTYVSTLVLETPALVCFEIIGGMEISCSFEYMPRLNKAVILGEVFNHDSKFRRSLSRIKEYLFLDLSDTMVPWYKAVKYSRLIECHIDLYDLELCESLLVLLSNCPKLKVFLVNCRDDTDPVTHLWNQPSSVPKCLSSHLEIFVWKRYAGRKCEKKLIRYILKKSKCLKTAGISPYSTCSAEEKQKMIEELKSMPRVSTSELMSSIPMLIKRYDKS